MKKLGLLMLVWIVGFNSVFSQDTIPNFDFEYWTKSGTFAPYQPDGWGTANAISLQLNNIAVRGTAAGEFYSGATGLVLTTVQVTQGSYTWPVAGTAVSGGKITTTAPFTFGGIKYTKRPTNLRGYCKYFPKYGIWPQNPIGEDPETKAPYAYGVGSLVGISAGDTVGLDESDIRVYFFKWNGTSSDTIARGQVSPTDTTFTQFICPIFYESKFPGNPDSAQIILASSKGKELAAGSKFYVDSISFDFTPGIGGVGVETLSQESFDLQQNVPNPFSQQTTIKFKSAANETVLFSIVDVLGQQVYSRKINAIAGENSILYSSTLQAGVYFYSVSNARVKSTKKMTVYN